MSTRLGDLWTRLVTALAAVLPVSRGIAYGLGASMIAVGLGIAWWVQRPLVTRPLADVGSAQVTPLVQQPNEGRPGDEPGRRADDGLATDGGAIDYQRAIERTTEERIESLLATVVGPGKVVARVAAAIDLARTERTEETYDPDKTVLREQHSAREATAGTKLAAADSADGSGRRVERRDESQTYEVSKTVSRTVAPVGGLKSLSVAVLVDGTYRDEAGSRVFVPRTEAELAKLKALVASAVGISEARGDHLEVTSAPFQTTLADPRASVLGWVAEWAPLVVGRAVIVVFVLGLLFLVGRLVQAAGTAAAAQAGRTGPGGPWVDDAEGRTGALALENEALARQNPERAAQLVRRWLLEDDAGVVRS